MLLYVDAKYLSPYAMSAFVALREKGIPFIVRTLDLAAGEGRRASYAAQSLTQRVPMMAHEGFCLSESSAIAEYVDEAFQGPALYPKEPQARARARQVQAWLRSDLLPLRQERPTEVVFLGQVNPPLTEAALAATQKLFAAAEALLAHGSGFIADAWSIADADLALMLNRLTLNGDKVPPALAEYANRQWQLASVQEWAEHARSLARQRL